MTAKNYIFAAALIIITPIFVAFILINLYRGLKKKKVIKKLGRGKTITLFSILTGIAVLVFVLLFALTYQVYILGVLAYLMSIFFILEKSSKILVRRMLRK